MRILLCFLLTLSCTLSAQVNVVIEDESDQGFYLGINRYLQHPEEQHKVILKNLDTIPYSIQIETDTFNFSKTIHLRQAGTYRYLLSKNSRGQLRLRYRGEGQAGQDFQSLSYSRDIPWPEGWQPKSPAIRKVPAAVVAARNRDLSDDEEGETRVPLSMPDSLVKNSEVLLPDNDTATNASMLVKVDTKPEEPDFPSLIKALEAEDFEFERLKQALAYAGTQSLTTAEVKEIFRRFHYDHSRLDFLRQSLSAIRDPQNLDQLKAELEYILSRQQLEQIISDEN